MGRNLIDIARDISAPKREKGGKLGFWSIMFIVLAVCFALILIAKVL